MELEIGQVYTFSYQSSSDPKPASNKSKVKARIKDEVINNTLNYLIENQEHIIDNEKAGKDYQKHITFLIKEMGEATDKKTKAMFKSDVEALKELYRERTKPTEHSDETKARNLFFRAYKPENMNFEEDGITALYMGKNYTINGKETYKWICLDESSFDEEKITDFKEYLEIE